MLTARSLTSSGTTRVVAAYRFEQAKIDRAIATLNDNCIEFLILIFIVKDPA
jgi:hypothetical protein